MRKVAEAVMVRKRLSCRDSLVVNGTILGQRSCPSLCRFATCRRASTMVEREAVTLALDHAFGFELADVGPAAIEVLR